MNVNINIINYIVRFENGLNWSTSSKEMNDLKVTLTCLDLNVKCDENKLE